MHVSRSDRETAVFVLSWTDIEKLLASVAQYLPAISISASCVDRLNRTFADIEELKRFGNSQRAAIAELIIIARDSNRSQRFSIALSNDERHNVRISLETDESIAIQLNDFYQDYIDSVRPWYSWIASADWYFVALGFWFFVQFGGFVIAVFKATSLSFEWPKDGVPGPVLLKSFLIGMLPLFVGAAMNRLRNRFFPTGTFAFGDGENRHNRNEVVRTALIAAFAVSVISSLVVSWLQ